MSKLFFFNVVQKGIGKSFPSTCNLCTHRKVLDKLV